MRDFRSLGESLRSLEMAREERWRKQARSARTKLRWRALMVKHCFHILPGETVLELGGGSGMWSEQLNSVLRSENPLTVAVFTPELLAKARERQLPNTSFVRVESILDDLPHGEYDYIVGFAALAREHMKEELAAVYRLLKPGGQILFFEANSWNYWLKLSPGFRRMQRAGGGFPVSRPKMLHACSHLGYTHIELAPYDLVPATLPDGIITRVQAKTVLFEHAPVLRGLCWSAYLWARKPDNGASRRPTPNLAEHAALFGRISVVVPCHNEAANIAELVERLVQLYGSYIREIIIVNDNSSDGTAEVAEKAMALESRIRLINRGKPNGVGRALRDGYKAATGAYILSMDCDFVEILPELRALFDVIAAGHDGAIGSRFSHESTLVNYPFSKLLFNRVFHAVVKMTLLRTVRDVTNNLKLYRAEILKELDIESAHFSANLETGLKPMLAGYDIKEVPISWINRTIGMGNSNFDARSVGMDYLRALFQIWRAWRFPKKHVMPVAPGPAAPAVPGTSRSRAVGK